MQEARAPVPSPDLLPGPHHEPDYHLQLRAALRRAPWFGISLGLHAVLLLVLSNMVWAVSHQQESPAIQAEFEPEDTEPPLVEPPIPPKERPKDPEVELDPLVHEDDPVELPRDVPDDARAPVDAVFTRTALHDIIGAGGGASGGGPAGRRRGGGGGKASQRAVDAGLDWLARHQEPDGFWDCDDFNRRSSSPLDDGRGSALHDVGVTGLALLAFLGAGNTSESGSYRDAVKRGLHWLSRQQDREDGCLGSKNGQHFIYGHALGTLAMVEGYHLSGSPLLRRPAQRAVQFIHRARTPYAGWRYDYPASGQSDSSITGWMLFALKAAEEAGLEVDDGAIRDGLAFLESMTDERGRTGYDQRGSRPARDPHNLEAWPAELSESLTAVGCLCRIFDGRSPDQDEALAQGIDLLSRRPPRWEDGGCIDFYYWYYGSYVMWQVGGRHWQKWQQAMLGSIIDHQRGGDGDERGSWDPQVDPWGHEGGRVYSTAINVLCLEVYYRYDHVLGAR